MHLKETDATFRKPEKSLQNQYGDAMLICRYKDKWLYIIVGDCELNKDGTNRHGKLHKNRLMRPQPHTNHYEQLKKSGSGKGGLSQGEHTNWLSTVKWLS